MFFREREIVTEEFVARKDTYNIKLGGLGGFDHINQGDPIIRLEKNKRAGRIAVDNKLGPHGFSPERKKQISSKIGKLVRDLGHGLFSLTPELRKEYSARGRDNALLPEAAAKRKKTFQETNHQKGSKNSQFGTIWITNGRCNCKINKIDTIPTGWTAGRKMKI